MACRCAWCDQLKRMDRKIGLLANRTWEKCPGASLLLFPPAGSGNRHRMLWIIHLSPKPPLKMDENGGSCCLDTSYPPKTNGIPPPRTPRNGWYRPHQSFHRKVQRCQPSPDNDARAIGQLGWFYPCQRVLKKLPIFVGHIAILGGRHRHPHKNLVDDYQTLNPLNPQCFANKM